MSKKIAAYIALYLSLIVLGACGLSAGTIVHPEIMVYQSTAGNSASNEIEERGYLQGPTGAVRRTWQYTINI